MNPNSHHILRTGGTKRDIKATFDCLHVLSQRLQFWLMLPSSVRLKDGDLCRFRDVRECSHNCSQLTQFRICLVQEVLYMFPLFFESWIACCLLNDRGDLVKYQFDIGDLVD